jgi:hypothetical protein
MASDNGSTSTPLWRAAFDAVERPIAGASESWLSSNTFLDGFAIAFKVQRRAGVELRRGLGIWLEALNLPSRADLDRVSNQLAGLERQVRELRTEVDGQSGDRTPLGLTPSTRRRPASRQRR